MDDPDARFYEDNVRAVLDRFCGWPPGRVSASRSELLAALLPLFGSACAAARREERERCADVLWPYIEASADLGDGRAVTMLNEIQEAVRSRTDVTEE